MCPFPQIIVEKFGIKKMPMSKEYKNPFLFLIGKKLLKTYQLMTKLVFLTTLYSNIFRNYIPNKIVKCSYSNPPSITKQIKSKLKNRSKITKEYYRKGQDPTIFAELSRISRECTNLKRNAKTSYIKKSNVLNDKRTDPSLLDHFE